MGLRTQTAVPALQDPQLEQFSQDALRNLINGMTRGKAATAAAKSAGYKGSSLAANARKRINRKDVKARMIELAAPRTEEAEAEIAQSWEAVQKNLYAISLQPVDGEKIKPADQIAAASLIAKIEGRMAPEKRELTGPNGGAIEIEDITLADRARALMELVNAAKAST